MPAVPPSRQWTGAVWQLKWPRKSSVKDEVGIGLPPQGRAKMRLGPTDKAELDSFWICHHSNFPFFKSVLI